MHRDALRRLVRESIVQEMARWKKEGVPRRQALGSIEEFTGPNSYVHYSDLNKLGINPQSSFDTPIGLYGYPLTPAYVQKLRAGRGADFARDRKYAHVFRPRESDTVLDLRRYDAARYSEDVEELRRRMKGGVWNLPGKRAVFDDVVTRAEADALVRTPAGMLWNLTRLLADKDPRRWTVILSKKLAYTGVRDDGAGIIHENEPAQAVFFDPRTIEHVTTFVNSIDTFSTSAPAKALMRYKQAEDRFWRMLVDVQNVDQDMALRRRLIDPFTKHPSSDVRHKAVEHATPEAQRAALEDEDEDVRRAALHELRRDRAVLRMMSNDPSPKVVDDLVDHIANEFSDPDEDAELLDVLRRIVQTHEGDGRWERVVRKTRSTLQDLS